MAAWRQALALVIEDEDLVHLMTIARSRTEPARRVERARILLAYRDEPSFFAVGRALGLHHQTVQRRVLRQPGLRGDVVMPHRRVHALDCVRGAYRRGNRRTKDDVS